MSLYDFAAQSIDNQPVALSQYKGQVMLIVNTASACGFTPQFTGLEKLHHVDRTVAHLEAALNRIGLGTPAPAKREAATATA